MVNASPSADLAVYTDSNLSGILSCHRWCLRLCSFVADPHYPGHGSRVVGSITLVRRRRQLGHDPDVYNYLVDCNADYCLRTRRLSRR
jgi:hypothetical protein